jgi:hypothetical protein
VRSSVSISAAKALIVVGNDVERLGLEALLLAVIDQRILAAVRDPNLRCARIGDGLPQLVPVGMVGDHQRQLHPTLLGPLFHAHPARSHRQHRIGQTPAPAILDRRRRRDDDLALELGLADL